MQVQQGQVTQVGQGPAPGHAHQLVILEREKDVPMLELRNSCAFTFLWEIVSDKL